MSKYVLLGTWTEQGIANVSGTVDRSEAFRQTVSDKGGSVTELLWILGRYDVMAVLEAPDDETAAAISMQLSTAGSIRTETLRAFTADEVTGIIDSMAAGSEAPTRGGGDVPSRGGSDAPSRGGREG